MFLIEKVSPDTSASEYKCPENEFQVTHDKFKVLKGFCLRPILHYIHMCVTESFFYLLYFIFIFFLFSSINNSKEIRHKENSIWLLSRNSTYSIDETRVLKIQCICGNHSIDK